jgi:LmbE family N-acetylglucosaminyl deacetylase
MATLKDDRRIRAEGTPEAAWASWPGLARLPSTQPGTLVPEGARVVVVAPHPDDEILMVGGLLAQLARERVPIRIIAVTDGCASHRGSSTWTRRRLKHVRPRESRAALHCLGIEEPPLRLELPDGGLTRHRTRLAQRLDRLFEPSDVVFTTWRRDGHPDHEAVAKACEIAAANRGAQLVEVPVWAWNWARPGDPRLPWRQAFRLPLDNDARRRKCFALQAFTSQLLPDASTGTPPVLDADMLSRAARPFEVMFR